jgi:hypothetical protein
MCEISLCQSPCGLRAAVMEGSLLKGAVEADDLPPVGRLCPVPNHFKEEAQR